MEVAATALPVVWILIVTLVFGGESVTGDGVELQLIPSADASWGWPLESITVVHVNVTCTGE
jgi:hypothetical protein